MVGTSNRQGVSPPPPFDHQAAIRFESVALDDSAPGRRHVGALAFLGGWSLSSTNGRFGGISAMHVDKDRVTALTDSGFVIRFPLPSGASGLVRGRIDPLLEGSSPPAKKEARDTEALAVSGSLAWVGYERRNNVSRYRTRDWRREAHTRPQAMRHWPRNGGSEGLVRLRDGRFLIFSEHALRNDRTSQLLLFDADPSLARSRSVTLGYRPPRGYAATDAAELPDGRLLILNRRLSFGGGMSARLAIASLPTAGDVMTGREIAALRPPVTVDNMEALSVTRESGRTIVWIASDDNFSPPLQRTLLMKFALVG